MLFIAVESANERSAELRRAADRYRRQRGSSTVHAARSTDPRPTRPKRAGRWGATVASVTRLAR
jgi:hypothetical protein